VNYIQIYIWIFCSLQVLVRNSERIDNVMARVDGVMGKADNLMLGLNRLAGGRGGGEIAWRAAPVVPAFRYSSTCRPQRECGRQNRAIS
jgi:hypothetical protein